MSDKSFMKPNCQTKVSASCPMSSGPRDIEDSKTRYHRNDAGRGLTGVSKNRRLNHLVQPPFCHSPAVQEAQAAASFQRGKPPRNLCHSAVSHVSLTFGFPRTLAFDQGTKCGEVFHVFMQVVGFVGFQTARPLLEPGVVDDVAKGFQADLAFADVFVPVHAGVEFGL